MKPKLFNFQKRKKPNNILLIFKNIFLIRTYYNYFEIVTNYFTIKKVFILNGLLQLKTKALKQRNKV